MADDCHSTLDCIEALGAVVEQTPEGTVRITPSKDWRQPEIDLDCGNSGTTMRLLSGLAASRPLKVKLVGDASLSRRPMRRIAEPLRLMGAKFVGDHAPITIQGGQLRGVDYVSPVASAQVKSCVLLAGLRAEGESWVTEPTMSRDHTERLLKALGANLIGPVDLGRKVSRVGVRPSEPWGGFSMRVPADISSAAFMMVLAALLPEAEVTFQEVGVNPTRTGILEVFKQARVRTEVGKSEDWLGEPVSDITVFGDNKLKPFHIEGSLVPRLIDEIPVLSVLATQCHGVSTIRDAKELRVKESDRIEQTAQGLRAMGARVETREDGLTIEGPTPLKGARIHAGGDHRLAMAFAVAGSIADGETIIEGEESVITSYPGFMRDREKLVVV